MNHFHIVLQNLRDLKFFSLWVTTLVFAPLVEPVFAETTQAPVAAGIRSITTEYASRVESDFYRQALELQIQQGLKDISFAIPESQVNTSLASEAPIVAQNIRARFQAGATSLTFQAGRENGPGVYTVKALNNSLKISIESITLDETITQSSGGIVATINVHAVCNNIEATFSDQGSDIEAVLAAQVVGPQIEAVIDRASVVLGTPTLNSWTASCTGAQGFEQLLQNQMANILLKPGYISQYAQNFLIQELQTQAATHPYTWSTPQHLSESTVLVPHILETQSDGSWKINGSLQMTFPSVKDEAQQIHFAHPDSIDLSRTGSYIVLPEDGLTEWLKGSLIPIGKHFTGSANEIKSFRHFLKNWFLKLILWPDLLNFDKKNSFTYDLQAESEFQLTWQSESRFQIAGKYFLNLAVDGREYVHWVGPVQSVLTAQFDKSMIRVTPSHTALSGHSRWADSQDHGYIATGVILGLVQTAFDGTPITLPSLGLTLTPGLNLGLDHFVRDLPNQVVYLYLSRP